MFYCSEEQMFEDLKQAWDNPSDEYHQKLEESMLIKEPSKKLSKAVNILLLINFCVLRTVLTTFDHFDRYAGRN